MNHRARIRPDLTGFFALAKERSLAHRWHRDTLSSPVLARFRKRGRVLAVKWGYNPNSSSLGVDVTFLLFGVWILAVLTPLVGLILRARGGAETPTEPPSQS
jgi:hypothetical protein